MVQAFGPVTFGVAALSLAVSAAGVWVTIRVAHMVGAIDVPNGRSSHSIPTTRMGGVAIVAAVVGADDPEPFVERIEDVPLHVAAVDNCPTRQPNGDLASGDVHPNLIDRGHLAQLPP